VSDTLPSAPFASRVFTEKDQMTFVARSGDANPIHADAKAAAALFPSAIILHGVHGVMWALDEYLGRQPAFAIGHVTANFNKPIRLEQRLDVVADATADGAKIKLQLNGSDATSIKVTARAAGPVADVKGTYVADHPAQPRLRALSELAGVAGTLTMGAAAQDLARLFPRLTACIGVTRVAGIASLATLVGMECPGLYGVSTAVDFAITESAGPLAYVVKRVDKRFARAEMAVDGYGLSGTVTAFVNEP
jgi:acyl dehydratase